MKRPNLRPGLLALAFMVLFSAATAAFGHEPSSGTLHEWGEQVDYDIKFVGDFKTALFGGEGLFYATLTGPGVVYMQTLPFSRLADRVITASGINRGESRRGGFLQGLGGLTGGDRGF